MIASKNHTKKFTKTIRHQRHRRVLLYIFILLLVIHMGKNLFENVLTHYRYLSNTIDISNDLTGDIPSFYQYDLRWSHRAYGNNTMKYNGCGPTCLSMVYCGLTGDKTYHPYQVAKMSEEHDFYIEGQGTSWNLMTEGAQLLGLHSEAISANKSSIVSALKDGKPIICSVGPGDFTTEGHFIVLTGINDDGTIRLHDPNSKKRSQQSWDIERLIPQIKALWAYSI